MKIVIPLLNLSLSGGIRIALQYAAGLAKKGHYVTLLLPDNSGEDYISLPENICMKKVRIHRILKPFGYLGIVFKMRKSVLPCDLIFAISWQSLLMILSPGIDLNRVFHLIQHDDAIISKNRIFIARWRNTILFNYIYRLPVKKIVVSGWLKEIILKKYGQASVCIPNGVDKEIFDGGFPANWTPSESQYFDVLCLARSVEWKGFNDLLSAMRIVRIEEPSVRLVIASREKIIVPSDIPVVFHRPENDVQLGNLYRTCSVFAFPSWIEGFGLPPLEAMANGAPVVTTYCGGVNDFAINGVNCLMVPPRCPDKLADAIKKIQKDKDLARKLSENGIETAKVFTMDAAVDKLENFFFENLR